MLPLYDLLDTILDSYTSPINSFNYHSRPTDRCYLGLHFADGKLTSTLKNLLMVPNREEWGLTPRRFGPRVTGPYHCAKGLEEVLLTLSVLFSRGYPSHPEMLRDAQGQFKQQANTWGPATWCVHTAGSAEERLRAPAMNASFQRKKSCLPTASGDSYSL